MSSKRQFLIPSYLTLLAQCSVTLAANFDNCAEKLKTEPIICNGTFFFCPNGIKPEGNKRFITRLGCETFCGHGYDLDPLDDIIIRFILWLLPVLILAAHFHFPTLGKANTLAVCWSLLGNPIGSLYAMLIRVEKGRSSCWRAVEAGFTNNKPNEANDCSNRVLRQIRDWKVFSKLIKIYEHSAPHTLEADTAADIAAICLACDEFGWHDPLDELVRHLTPPSSHSFAGARNPAGKDARNDRDKVANTEQETNEETLLIWKKILYLAECRHDLISHRSDSQSGTTFAIIGLIGAVASGFIKSWMDRHKLFSSRTIPMVILSYHFIALVRISGIIGAFTSVFGPMLALQKLQKRFKALEDSAKQEDANTSDREESPQENLWLLSIELQHQPSTSLQRRPTSTQEKGRHGDAGGGNANQSLSSGEGSALSLSRTWLHTARYLGMNPTWRPHKPGKPWNPFNQNFFLAWKPFALAFLCVTTSWLFAFLHSYFYVPRPGFGCRALTWTMIYSAWLISLAFDFAFKYLIHPDEILWSWTWIKDMVISLLIITTIIITHIGLQTTCYCKSGTIVGDKHIDLYPPDSVAIWVEMGGTAVGGLGVMLLLIYFAGHFGDHTRSVLCPSRDERHVIQLRLQELREKVKRLKRKTRSKERMGNSLKKRQPTSNSVREEEQGREKLVHKGRLTV